MMTEEQAEAMNDLTVYEVRLLHDLHGLNAITGNGQLTALVDDKNVKKAEAERCANGY